jgi:Rod binding domain-containing protein
MAITPLPSGPIDPASLPLDHLTASTKVSQQAKVAEVSRAFEAILLRQILQESQKPVFKSKFVGNSTADGIYRDLISNQLAESISKSGSLGLGKTLARELQPAPKIAHPKPATHTTLPSPPAKPPHLASPKYE